MKQYDKMHGKKKNCAQIVSKMKILKTNSSKLELETFV